MGGMRWAWLMPCLVAAAGCGRSGLTGEDGGGRQVPIPWGLPGESPPPSPTPTPDPYGDGGEGTQTLQGVINTCTGVIGATGNDIDVVSSTDFLVGRKLLLLQMRDSFADADAANETSDAGDAGTWEIATISAVTVGAIEVSGALASSYDSTGDRRAQVCTLPQYQDLTVAGATQITAETWDGARGGVVAFMVSGVLTLDGDIDAAGAGFRGGVRNTANTGSSTAWDTSSTLGAGKGEGTDGRSAALYGRGCYRSAGGGGNGRKAGGAGGAGGGNGGGGALSENGTANTGGIGGVAPAGPGRLFAGGGGGAGHIDAASTGSLGGDGGGIVWILAKEIASAGNVDVSGVNGADSVSSDGGGGAGGGGGTIRIGSDDIGAYAGLLVARGGNGGSTQDNSGPGGGGGGGRVILVLSTGYTMELDGGVNGLDGGGAANGASAGAGGTTESD